MYTWVRAQLQRVLYHPSGWLKRPNRVMEDLSSLGPEFHQDIILDGTENAHTIHTFDVHIYGSSASDIREEDAGSNKVKITTFTNQNWEIPVHRGRMVASNISYLAYVLEGRTGSVIRLIRRDNSFRALLKGFVGAVMDVAFCHSRSNLLACLDEGGNLHIWDLDMAKAEATVQKDALKIIVQHGSSVMNGEHRLVWSPHILSEEEEEDQDICSIVVTHGNCAEVLDVTHVFSKYSSGCIVPRDKLLCNLVAIPNAHEDDILDLSLSPDGSVLATAGKDGHLKFWQVNLEGGDHEEPPKCLHDFKPHKGAAVTRLMFCDNHLCQDPNNQFWRFLLTASENNTEVKMWCTVNWKCLQTIRFLPPKNSLDPMKPSILLNMDLSASYLIVADSRRKVFLVLQLTTSLALGDASITSVTEYLLTQPILSFVVCGCAAIPERIDRDEYSDGESGEEEEESRVTMRGGLFDTRRNVAMIKLHCVHTRSMQELLVRFEPPDLFGVPPSREYSKLKLPGQKHNSNSSETLKSPHDAHLLSTLDQQPISLSAENTTPTKHSVTQSPKLLTPSEITSKHEAIALLSPADILASASSSSAADQLQTAQDWPVFNQAENSAGDTTTSISQDTGSNSPSIFPILNQSPTLTGQKDLVDVATPQSPLESENEVMVKPCDDATGTEGKEEKEESITETISQDQASASGIMRGTASEDEEEPSQEDRKKAFENIMEMLQVNRVPEIPVQHQSFEEFKELLMNPEKMQEEKRRLEDSMSDLPVHEGLPVNEPVTTDPSHDGSEDKKDIDESKEKNVVVDKEGPGDLDALQKDIGSDGVNQTTAEESLTTSKDALQGGTSEEAPYGDSISAEKEVYGKPTSEVHINRDEVPANNTQVAEMLLDTTAEPPQESANQEGDSEKKQEAVVSLGMAEAHSLQGDISNEVCSVVKSTEVQLTMPCALSDSLDIIQGVTEAEQLQTVATPIPQTPEATKSVQKVKKARKRAKKKKGEANTVDAVDIEERVSDAEINGSDSQLVLVEPPQEPQLDPVTGPESVVVANVQTLDAGPGHDFMLDQLTRVVAAQRDLLQKMQAEHHTSRVAMQVEIQRLREGLLEEQKTMMTEFRREQQSRLDRLMKEKQSMDKAKQDKLISSISQTLTTAVQVKLDKLIKTEMRNSAMPVINESMSSVRGELSKCVTHCISQTSDTIKNRLTELMKSKEMSDAIGKAVAIHLQEVLPAVLENIFKAVVLEPVERAIQGMFKQVDETFRKGTLEYLVQLQQQQQQLQSSVFQHVDSSLQALRTTIMSPQSSVPWASHIQDTIHQEMTMFSQRIQEGVLEAVSSVVHKEVAELQAKAAPHKNSEQEKKAQISQLIKAQRYNEAFEMSLSTADLHLVIFTCQQLDPDTLFDSSPFPLSQAVLLSLIQQLSVNLIDNLEMKIKFLDPSVLALDVHDEVTKSHMAPVIKQLSQQLHVVQDKASTSTTSITPTLLKQVKRLYQVTLHMCH